ncbi:unnamed protein product [Clavelina lepadiformis]|uniref:Structural maintenance of chromosomes protein n=1 Tax=Clavelina lepadiformis TaxID=159417 RepID=A0ABP0FSN6_CLALP
MNITDELQLPEGITVPPPPHVYGVGSQGEPRLIITHIVNYNFKSYSGRQVLGPFHKSFTAIIGPNGSGKSNIIDSMLFVFGYRANKIRSKKISVLIHDSEKKEKAGSCTVEVHFEKITDLEDGGYCTVPNSTFSISRKAFRDNSSQYFINDKKSAFKDVAVLLQENGVDLNHNRFLILQGEVEQIALMKPKSQTESGSGMLEFLEDIIGTSRYKDAIEKLGKEIEFLDEERKDKLTRVKVIEKDKEQLEPLRNEALNYLQKKNDKTRLDNELTQCYAHKFTKAGELNRERLNEAKVDLKEVEQSLEKLENQLKEKAKECHQVTQVLEKCHQTLMEKKDQMRELESVNVKVFEDRKFRKNKIKELNRKRDQDTAKLEKLKCTIEKHEREIEDSNQDRDEISERKKETEKKLAEVIKSLKSDTQQLQDEKEALESVLLEEVKFVNEAKQQLDVAKMELELLVSSHTNAEEALHQCRRQIEECKEAEQNAKHKLKETNAASTQLERKKLALKEELDKINKKIKELENQNEECLSALADAKVTSQMSRSNANVYKFFAQLKASGKIPGIYGRLGDLGVIDDKYDVAISSCCSALENILVDNIDTAQKCVEALKKQEIGQATFIALDKMAKYEHAIRHGERASLPKLVDLIKLKEERFRVAFYHALSDTLVADDLSTATKAAFGEKRRWRVVTLHGEVVDTAGTMSGGGNKVMKGRMGSKYAAPEISNEDLTRLKRQSEDFEQQLTELRYKVIEKESALSKYEIELGKCKSTTNLFQQEVNSQHSLLNRLQQRLPELEGALLAARPDPKVHKQLETKVNQLHASYEKTVKKTTNLEKKKKDICEKISEISERRLQPIKCALEDQKKSLEKIAKQITKLKVTLTSSRRAITKFEKELINMAGDIDGNAKEIKKLEEEWKCLESKAAAVLEEIDKAEEEEKSSNDELQQKQQQFKEIEEKRDNMMANEKTLRQTYENFLAQENANLEKVKQWKDSLLKLKLHEVDGETVETLQLYSEDELEECNEQEVRNRICIIESEIRDLQPNMNAIADYREKQTVYLQRVAELDEVTVKREQYRRLLDHLRKSRLNEFSKGFSIITNKLKEIYQMITLGGDAELEFVDSLDPFSEGIAFSVRPPKKSWKNICNLSGGEKTLSSLALVFSLHHYRPTPLYVMDEIDAALDFKNVTIIAHYIVERTKNAQFIIISLRNNMFEVADRLVGIYKTDNCTKSATIEPSLIAIKP